MKKLTWLLLPLLLIIAIHIGFNHNEYKIINTYKNTFDNYQSVTLQVLVNVRNYDENEILCKVRDFYYTNNGIPDKLRINLYDSKHHFEKSICRIGKTF